MVHLESKLFLQPPTLVARYFRDTEVWANSEPYLASSKFDDFPSTPPKQGLHLRHFMCIPYRGTMLQKREMLSQVGWHFVG